MLPRTRHRLRASAEVTLLSLVVASSLTLWSRPVATTNVTPQQDTDADDWTVGGLDISARERTGVASFYAREFFGRRMADGAPMNPRGNNAASRTLPLGTVARVTDVATGRSAVVRIEDRGPYVKGRIVDLSPTTARKIGITARMGVDRVVVAPLAVPLPGGGIKVGAAANESEQRLALAMTGTNTVH
jgi:rare lipoprotein A